MRGHNALATISNSEHKSRTLPHPKVALDRAAVRCETPLKRSVTARQLIHQRA